MLDVENKKKCGSPLRNKPGKFCQKEKGLFPNGRCYIHGGKTPHGIAHPKFTTGAHSKYLPARMLADYDQYRIHPERLELRDDIALVHARAIDLIARVDSGESGHLWKQLQTAYADLTKAEDGHEQLVAIAEIGSLIRRGAADYANWEEIGKTIDRKQRLVESERKRQIEQQQTLTLEQATFLFRALFQAVVKHVDNLHTRAAIQAEFERVAYRPDSRLDGHSA